MTESTFLRQLEQEETRYEHSVIDQLFDKLAGFPSSRSQRVAKRSDQFGLLGDPSESLPTYQWTDLTADSGCRTIRVFELFKAPLIDRRLLLKGRLHEVRLEDCDFHHRSPSVSDVSDTAANLTDYQHCCQYEALSYTWGGEVNPEYIICDGAVLWITTSLWNILHSLREEPLGTNYSGRPPRSRYLWIDQICMNQAKRAELESQVRLMPEVYSKASNTIVCLVYDSFITDFRTSARALLETVAKLEENAQTQKLKFFGKVGKRELDWEKELQSRFPETWAVQLAILQRLFENPWFKRTWIVQELAVSPTIEVLYGLEKLDWKKIVATARVFSKPIMITCRIPREILRPAVLLNQVRDEYWGMRRGGKQANLLDLLDRLRHRLAGKEKDLIYSLLGLVQDLDFDRYHLHPNYKERFETHSLFIRVAEAIVRSTNALEILEVPHMSTSSLRDVRLPSWVPDWRVGCNMRSFRPQATSLGFFAGKDSKNCYNIGDFGTLHLSGIALGIANMSADWPSMFQQEVLNNIALAKEVWSTLKACDDFVLAKHKKTCLNGQDMTDVYCQTMLAGDGQIGYKKRLDIFHTSRSVMKTMIKFLNSVDPNGAATPLSTIIQLPFVHLQAKRCVE